MKPYFSCLFLIFTLSSFVRSGCCIPQYRFIALHSAGYVSLHSSSIMSAPSIFSAVAPSIVGVSSVSKTSLCPKSRNAKGCLIFFPAVSRSYLLRFAPFLRSTLAHLWWLFDCRNTANFAPHTYASAIAPFWLSLRCLGRLIADSKKHPEKYKQETSCYKKK
jgi:hypothetical protein